MPNHLNEPVAQTPASIRTTCFQELHILMVVIHSRLKGIAHAWTLSKLSHWEHPISPVASRLSTASPKHKHQELMVDCAANCQPSTAMSVITWNHTHKPPTIIDPRAQPYTWFGHPPTVSFVNTFVTGYVKAACVVFVFVPQFGGS